MEIIVKYIILSSTERYNGTTIGLNIRDYISIVTK